MLDHVCANVLSRCTYDNVCSRHAYDVYSSEFVWYYLSRPVIGFVRMKMKKIHKCDTRHSYACHVRAWQEAFIWVTLLIHMCDMTHAQVWHEAFICVTFICIGVSLRVHHKSVGVCSKNSLSLSLYMRTIKQGWHDSFRFVTWLIYRWMAKDSAHIHIHI